MMKERDATPEYAKQESQQGGAFQDSRELMNQQQGQSSTTNSDRTNEPFTNDRDDKCGENSAGKRKRIWKRTDVSESIGENIQEEEEEEKLMDVNKKERNEEPSADGRRNTIAERQELKQMFFKSAEKSYRRSQDDSRTLMVAKAQHEVTSLSPTERNRILESIHGIVAEEVDDEGTIETDLSCGSFSAIVALASRNNESIEFSALDHKVYGENKASAHGDDKHSRGQDEQEPSLPRGDTSHEQRFIQRKLEELDEALRQIQQKVAYDQAVEDLVEYVEDPKFRLIFLRADLYDTRKAAARLVAFLDEKLKRFGPEALTRQLTIEDLSGTAKSLFAKKGVFQVLPTRDSSGRAILVAYYQATTLRIELREDPSSLGDAMFYLLSSMAEDEATQRRGIVTLCVISATPQPEKKDIDVILRSALEDMSSTINYWCPLKCNAHHHWIYDDNSIVSQLEGKHHAMPATAMVPGRSNTAPTTMSTSLMSGAAVFDTIIGCVGKEYRIRTRLHEGSFEEYKGKLKTFGIPVDQLPFSIDGSEIRASGSHCKWLQKRRQKENVLILRRQSLLRENDLKISMMGSTNMLQRGDQHDIGTTLLGPSCFDVIDIPGRHDVCLGRGTTLHQHSGNIAMRAMMEPLVDEYEKATSTRRQDLNKVIIQAVHLIGGKFLTNKTNDGAWFEVVTDMSIVEKSIGGIFRSMVSRVNASKKSSWTIGGSSNP